MRTTQLAFVAACTVIDFGAPLMAQTQSIRYENDQRCLVQLSQIGNVIVINAGQETSKGFKQVQVDVPLTTEGTASISTYCSNEASLIKVDHQWNISCPERLAQAHAEFDLDASTFSLSFFRFAGSHRLGLFNIDDSFQCENLQPQ